MDWMWGSGTRFSFGTMLCLLVCVVDESSRGKGRSVRISEDPLPVGQEEMTQDCGYDDAGQEIHDADPDNA